MVGVPATGDTEAIGSCLLMLLTILGVTLDRAPLVADGGGVIVRFGRVIIILDVVIVRCGVNCIVCVVVVSTKG
jgi:hypothetical protein